MAKVSDDPILAGLMSARAFYRATERDDVVEALQWAIDARQPKETPLQTAPLNAVQQRHKVAVLNFMATLYDKHLRAHIRQYSLSASVPRDVAALQDYLKNIYADARISLGDDVLKFNSRYYPHANVVINAISTAGEGINVPWDAIAVYFLTT